MMCKNFPIGLTQSNTGFIFMLKYNLFSEQTYISLSCFFAETIWSLKHLGHLSHSCIKTRHNSVF